jgi:hypothetical protein
VRRGASWTAAYHLQPTVAAVARPVRSSMVPSESLLLSGPGMLLAQPASARRSVQPASGGRASSPWSTPPGRQPWHRSPVGVQHAVSSRLVSSSGIRRSSRPVSSPSGVRSPGVVVRGPAVRPAAVHPSSVQPSGVHPSGVQPSAVRPVRPDASGSSHVRRWRLGPRLVRRGTRHHGNGSRSRWAAAPLSGSVDGRGSLDRAVLPSRALVGGGSVADPGRVGCGRRPRVPGWATRQARPACGAPVAGGGARAWEEAAARGGRSCGVAAVLGWVGDHGGWLSWRLPPGWAGPEGTSGRAGGDGCAAPARPRQATSVRGLLPAAL